MAEVVVLPMIATVKPAPLNPQRLKTLMAELSGQHERLATDLPFFKQQAAAMLQATVNLHERCGDQTACQQLLCKEPQLLQQQVAITTAALQQLSVQLDKDIVVCRTAAMLADTLGLMLLAVRVRACDSQTPCAADATIVTMLHDKGLLKAYSAAATAAAPLIHTPTPQLPRGDTTRTTPVVLQLMDNPLHLFAAASHALILLWDTIADLVPIAELLPAESVLLDSVIPTASLSMVLARAYAGDETFCVPVMYHVLTGGLMFARAALSGPHDKHYRTLAHRDVYELLLLCLAVGTGLLHAEYKGVSKQSLLPSMRAAGSSGSSGKPRRLAVSAHHEEQLHALLGVRRLAAADDLTASTVSYTMWLIPHAVYEASRMRMKEEGSTQGGLTGVLTVSGRKCGGP